MMLVTNEFGHASNEEEEAVGYLYEVVSSNGLVLTYAESMSFLLRTPEIRNLSRSERVI